MKPNLRYFRHPTNDTPLRPGGYHLLTSCPDYPLSSAKQFTPHLCTSPVPIVGAPGLLLILPVLGVAIGLYLLGGIDGREFIFGGAWSVVVGGLDAALLDRSCGIRW